METDIVRVMEKNGSSRNVGCKNISGCSVYVYVAVFLDVVLFCNTLYAKDTVDRERAMERIAVLLEETLEEALLNRESTVGTQYVSGKDFRELADMAAEYFECLLEHPLAINRAGRKELEEFILLSDFQIESILEYRKTSGDILSLSELSLLNGFDAEFAEGIAPFISFASSLGIRHYREGTSGFFKGRKSQMYFRWAREFTENRNRCIGTPYYMQLRYKCIYSNKLQVGMTFENDAGERLFASGAPPVDFSSFHIAAKNVGRINTFIIGDYSARFGQGLALWNSFALQGASSPTSLYKRGAVFVPYTSSGESGFYRGAALSLSFGNTDISAMFSYNRLDARIVGNEYVSLITGGIHNTVGAINARKRMAEAVGGVNISHGWSRLKIAFSCVAYGYNKKNGRKVYDYNRFQMYDGMWGNISADFYAVIRRVKLFGEFAIDYGGSTAMLAGAVFTASPNLEIGCMIRCYSKSYIAPHASAYSTISSVSNQNGLAVSGKYSISSKCKIGFGGDAVYYPWVRYNIKKPSGLLKGYALAEYTADRFAVKVRFSDVYTTHNRLNKFCFKAHSSLSVTEEFSVKLGASAVYAAHTNYIAKSDNYRYTVGYLGYYAGANVKYAVPDRKFSVQAGCNIFNCNNWNCRLYVYEPDMPYTYNSRLLYGKGCSLYTVIKLRVLKQACVYLKYETMQYTTSLKEAENQIKMAVKCNL